MANLAELQKEQQAINTELRANQATVEDIDSTVDDIQRALNRNGALNIRLSAVQRKISQEQAAIAEAARAQKVAEGARLMKLAENKMPAIVQAMTTLRALIKEQHAAMDDADKVLAPLTPHYMGKRRMFRELPQLLENELMRYEPSRFDRAAGVEGVFFVDKGAL